jgi:hypothetical protein
MIPTAKKLEVLGRRLDRKNAAVRRVLHLMQFGGRSLHLHFRNRPRWHLSDGREVPAEVANLVIQHRSVVGVGDALISGCAHQTYRFAEASGAS